MRYVELVFIREDDTCRNTLFRIDTILKVQALSDLDLTEAYCLVWIVGEEKPIKVLEDYETVRDLLTKR